MNLRFRSSQPELMDNEGSESEIRSALKELKTINKFLGGNSVSATAVNQIRKKFNLENISILDAGSGASDILKSGKLQRPVKVTSLDKNKFICSIIKESGSIEDVTCADAMYLPYRDRSFDVVHLSLFLHHFETEQLQRMLNRFCCTARYGVVINDLQRSYLAYYGFVLLSFIISRNRLVKHDGALSVRRGFKKDELIEVLNSIDKQYEIRWRWAFRWQIIIYCND